MTQKEILEIALAQSASDSNCAPKDFLSEKNKIVFSEKRAEARRYLELPFLCDFVSYGHNVVASVSPQYYGVAAEYISRFPPNTASKRPLCMCSTSSSTPCAPASVLWRNTGSPIFRT